jgi:hypothetical protein
METPGTLVDKLITVDLKMWNNQEALYEIRRMTFDEFHAKYKGNEELYNILKKACDLNVQRNSLMNELDEKFLEMFKSFAEFSGMSEGVKNNTIARLNTIYNIKPHKTY